MPRRSRQSTAPRRPRAGPRKTAPHKSAAAGPKRGPIGPKDLPFPGEMLRAVRRSLGLTQGELAKVLEVGEDAIRRYERQGAPIWVPYALVGVGVLEHNVPVDEMCRRVGLSDWEGESWARTRSARSPGRD